MQKLTMVAQDPEGTLAPGFPDESWDEYADRCFLHDDMPGSEDGHGTFSRYVHGPDASGIPGKGCRCDRCRRANADQYARRKAGIRAGTWRPYVDAGPARAHLEQLAARGVRLSEVARQSGVRLSVLYMLTASIPSKPQVKRVKPGTEAAVLAVPLPRKRVASLPESRDQVNWCQATERQASMTRFILRARSFFWPAACAICVLGLARSFILAVVYLEHERWFLFGLYDVIGMLSVNGVLYALRRTLAARRRR